MELPELAQRYAEALGDVDATTVTQKANRRTHKPYDLGLHALGERDALAEADSAWERRHPGELLEPDGLRLGVPYPNLPNKAACDHVFSTIPGDTPEWGVEAKFVSFVGNNGKGNDHGVGKILSPYLRDRGVLHDVARLRESTFTRRAAVMLYAFNYDSETCDEAERRHGASETIDNIRHEIKRNGAPLHARPVIVLLDAILGLRGELRGPREEAAFEAWRSPAGGRGTVFVWEIRRSRLEPDYDPRHPW